MFVPRKAGLAASVGLLFLSSFAAAYGAAPITTNLLVSVEANSSSISGTTWSATDGTSNNATLQASGMYTSPNTYVTFGDATNQYANFGNVGSTASDISGEAWIYINTMHSGWNIVMSKWYGGGETDDWHFGFDGAKLRLCYQGNCPSAAWSSSTTAAGAWHHVAFTIKQPSSGLCTPSQAGGVVTLYMDGAQVAQDTGVGACHPTSSTSLLLIGDNRGAVGNGLDGRVSKFRFFTQALTASEIGKIFRAEASQFSLTAAPYATALPTFSGSSSRVGVQQTGSQGTWINTPTGYTYRWYRSATSGGSYAPIAGATSINYTSTSADANQYLKFEVTASNATGSIAETSTATMITQSASSISVNPLPVSVTSNSVNNITSTPGSSGLVTFYSNGKRIAKCISLAANAGNSYTVTCPWKPTVTGSSAIHAIFKPTDIGYANATSSPIYTSVVRRSGKR